MPPPPPAIITTPAPTTNIKEETEDDSLSQYSYSSEASSSFYTSHALRSPISPLSPSHFSPTSSPSLSAQHSGQTFSSWESHSLTHLPPLNLSGTISTNPSTSRPITPSSLPSLSEISANLPSIPTIIEPSNPVSSPSMDMDGNNSTTGSHAKRLHRQTLPRLQLAPPSFHHLHPSSNQSGVPSSPSNYGQDSLTSPASAHSAYSSTSGSWSSSSSSFGPFSTASSPGPLSPYGGTSPRSPGYSPHGLPSTNLLSTSSSYPH
ncbi:hypothetical protein BCR41DRAFT_348431 [Lobosporangium transversale]|uniref:Uncharacterized protein n=1 Tax=Lobosporangium transversale TaxID=64571 RepID=A0A1Y2GW75_9FUNG|nr:hypothetical protein BCR41DRAFT_348431 [Lobosporangium transversale]ORZ26517.1 hypothetical protein BCR41DRAFT_348431 [Lobosporangium transversale]|eukprot:XP_021884282.1 hypothetical protein BCR41DRAFT_348431 [Lobosporangium transversale]